ncbi:hypothetical protein H6A05_02060 [Megasphaera elsdenii]|uniref:hypothetical protein n=1 Tax=Megasphaera elsdenii TaxID=907 RepID=UPI00195D1001|nr:hypothetical protein [Megasphaera elsdenii]MBM6701111.1 hypothetical protein [Megasphaera elsdenii]
MTSLEKNLLDQVTFIVDKENRIVKCLPKFAKTVGLQRAAEGIVATMVSDKMEIFSVTESTFLFTPALRQYRLNKNQCFAVAKCSPNDTFDEKIGKRVAFNKLKLRLERVAVKVSAKIAYNASQACICFESDIFDTLDYLADNMYNNKGEE